MDMPQGAGRTKGQAPTRTNLFGRLSPSPCPPCESQRDNGSTCAVCAATRYPYKNATITQVAAEQKLPLPHAAPTRRRQACQHCCFRPPFANQGVGRRMRRQMCLQQHAACVSGSAH